MMKKCPECGSNMIEQSSDPSGEGYSYFKCKKCGNEILNTNRISSLGNAFDRI